MTKADLMEILADMPDDTEICYMLSHKLETQVLASGADVSGTNRIVLFSDYISDEDDGDDHIKYACEKI